MTFLQEKASGFGRPQSKRKTDRSGFSIAGVSGIEISIILFVIALAIVIGIVMSGNASAREVTDDVARDVADSLRVAQITGVERGGVARCAAVLIRPLRVEVRPLLESDRRLDCEAPSIALFYEEWASRFGPLVKTSGPMPLGVRIASNATGDIGVVTFLPSGSPCTTVTCARHVTVELRGLSKYVCVAPQNGVVTVRSALPCPN